MLGALYHSGLRATGIAALARHARAGGVILCYHNVVGDEPCGGDVGLHLPVTEFVRQVDWLGRHYQVIPLAEFADRVRANRSVRHLAVVTFDDGYRGVFTHAWPVLRGMGIPATVFIPTDLIQRGDGFWWDHPSVRRDFTPSRRESWLTDFRGDAEAIGQAVFEEATPFRPAVLRPADWSTIGRAAVEGLELGVHSATHRNLTCLDDDELTRELCDSRERLWRECGVRGEAFAYPYGIFDARVRAAVRGAGYRAAVTVEYGLNSPQTDPWALKRVNIPSPISDAAFETWVSGLRPRLWGAE